VSLSIAWTASIVPLVCEWLRLGGLDFQAQSRLGWVFLPWLALTGLPRTRRRASPWLAMSLAAPMLVAAGLQDHLAGRPGVLHTAGVGCALLLLLDRAAHDACGGTRRDAYGLAWTVLVPGAVMLHVALTWGAGPGREASSRVVSFLASASPLGWSFARMGAVAASPFAPLAACLLLLVIARGAGREALGP
jgi:hypothetical protein